MLAVAVPGRRSEPARDPFQYRAPEGPPCEKS